ncbi:RICIN domain-containing protein [Streptomyces hyaluromycini]|uniref:RICIN domain-containing protein n=1 Tax=Streptomyces hyaluromycini TaxID=1377993 RepID=UPI000B5CAE7E|nr:RICIN domain-containing protein [Streptomyces hyaluromycini]
MVQDIQGDPPPDARLTELLRAPAPTAYPALQELRTRHHPAVLGHARLCTTGDAAARRLATQTFSTAAREIAHGAEPVVPLRHHLLLLTARLAADWSHDERSAALDPTLLLVLNSSGTRGIPGTPGVPPPPLLPAFQSLPSRTQGLVWYGVLDREPAERTATYLGLTPEDVRYDTPPALQSLAQACLRTRLAASDDPRCADFRRLIEESVRPENPRHSPDLHAHMARCPHCTAAFEDLTALRDAPRETLAEGLLPWAGTAYVRLGITPAPPTEPGPGAAPPRERRLRSRRLLLTSTALGVALVPLLLFLLNRPAPHTRPPAAATPPVQVTVTATVSPSPSPSPARPSHSPSPSPSATPTRSATPTPSATPKPPGTAYAQVVNAATARCLDIRDADLGNGTDVVTAPCSASPTQRWRVDTARGVLQSAADPDFCLDSRGSVDKGVGIWSCASVDGDHGDNLRFTVTPDGEICPEIALETALTPTGADQLSLSPVNDGTGQHWRAGAG